MTARIIDGKAIAAEVRAEVAQACAELAKQGVTPGLATVLVGDDPASHIYVRTKRKSCAEVGIKSWDHDLCLLYTSPSPRDGLLSRMPSSA